jgi:hypothetical protein
VQGSAGCGEVDGAAGSKIAARDGVLLEVRIVRTFAAKFAATFDFFLALLVILVNIFCILVQVS